MKKVLVDPAFWALFPEAQINVLSVTNLDNHYRKGEEVQFSESLQQAAKVAEKYVQADPISKNPVVAEWRDAFSKFKTKKGARSSIEALLKRVKQGKEFVPINPLVDIYNSISLIYGVPCGGEDVAKIQGNLHLGKAKGGEPFFPLGADSDSPALADEIIYYDDEGAVCRCFNWREAQRTMLTEETETAVFVIEAINAEQIKRANEAIAELKALIEAHFEVEAVIGSLNEAQSEFVL